MFVLNLRQNLVNRHNERIELYCTRVFIISLSIPFNILVIYSIPLSSSSVIFLLFLFHLGLLHPFYCCQGVLSIHILMCL